VMESAIGIGLLTQRFRKLGVIAALGMHIFILASIGPFGHNHNSVVWPWNVAMGTFVVLLFWRENSGARRIVWGRGFQLVVLMLFAVLPALSFVDLWDSYLSFALYSGNQREAVIAMSDDVAARLPDAMQELVTVYDSESRVDTLDVREWSYAELNVPPYAELRVLRNAGRRVCSFTGNPSAMVMIVDGKRSWFHARPRKLYTCAVLQR